MKAERGSSGVRSCSTPWRELGAGFYFARGTAFTGTVQSLIKCDEVRCPALSARVVASRTSVTHDVVFPGEKCIVEGIQASSSGEVYLPFRLVNTSQSFADLFPVLNDVAFVREQGPLWKGCNVHEERTSSSTNDALEYKLKRTHSYRKIGI